VPPRSCAPVILFSEYGDFGAVTREDRQGWGPEWDRKFHARNRRFPWSELKREMLLSPGMRPEGPTAFIGRPGIDFDQRCTGTSVTLVRRSFGATGAKSSQNITIDRANYSAHKLC